MRRLRVPLSLACLATAIGVAALTQGGDAPVVVAPTVSAPWDDSLESRLEAIRSRYRLPALAGMSFDTAGILEVGVSGVRALGYPEPADRGDQWHIGSLTKSMTATLAAILVERGRIRWDTTVAAALPDLPMRPEYATVRLEELLTHTAGLITDLRRVPSWVSYFLDSRPIHQQRRQLTAELLAFPPESIRGSYSYANADYVVAGTMIEEVTGAAWEDLIARLLFSPLGMGEAGFGPPGTADRPDQPWGHAAAAGRFQPVPPGPYADNPPVIGPAGRVHDTLADLAAFYRAHLDGARGVPSLLSPESFARLHQPAPGTDSASGWLVVERAWAGGAALYHSGSNTMWYAVVWLAPSRGFGVFVVTNAGGDAASRATDEAAGVLIERVQAAGAPP